MHTKIVLTIIAVVLVTIAVGVIPFIYLGALTR